MPNEKASSILNNFQIKGSGAAPQLARPTVTPFPNTPPAKPAAFPALISDWDGTPQYGGILIK